MSRHLPLGVLAALLATGCATKIAVDPEGYKCDVGDVCPSGYSCVSGVCHANGTGGGTCTASQCKTPPANTCKDSSTLIAYSANGSCSSTGSCTYASNEVACAMGCANGACIGDACAGVSCQTPPATECIDASNARVFSGPGTCQSQSGTCEYPQMSIACPGGCANGVCNGANLCANVTCTTSPASQCAGNVLQTFASNGTCDPANGQCTYAETDTPCPGACVAGACVAASKAFAQVGPRVRSAVTALDLGPGASGASAIVVGPKGYAARWDGTTFTQLNTNTTSDLKAVWMRTATVGYIVGASGTALKVDGTTVTPITLTSTSTVDLVSVHGFVDTNKNTVHVLIAGKNGSAWRSTDGVTFTKAPAPSTSNTYSMVQAFVADDDSERISGLCTTLAALDKACILYATSATSTSWFVDPTSSSVTLGATTFGAVGPSPSGPDFALVSQGINVYRHDSSTGSIDTTDTPTVTGTSVKGIAADSSNNNAAFLVTSGSPGRLYRWVKGNPPTELLKLYMTTQSMSRNDAGGVLVADSEAEAANIFRRGAITNEALDLAEDWVDVDALPSGRTVFVNVFGDLAALDAGKSVYDFARSPFTSPDYEGVVAANGYALLFGVTGKVVKYTPANGFVSQAGSGTSDLHAGCRNSDTEVYLVGDSGKALSYNGTALTAMTTGTSESLVSVACTGAGEAFAAGSNGTVLKLSGGAWSKVTPAIGTAVKLTSVFATPTELYVAGDNALYVFSQGAWKSLPGLSGLTQLVGYSGTELYGVSGTDVQRFDGTAWTPVFAAPSDLLGATQSGSKVTFVGSGGLVVQSK